MDGLRRRARGGPTARDKPQEFGAAPQSVFVTIPHWRYEQGQLVAAHEQGPELRSVFLARCIESVLGLEADQVTVAVITNAPEVTAAHLREKLSSMQIDVVRDPSRLDLAEATAAKNAFVVGWRPRSPYRHRYYLAWGHKALLRRALPLPRYTHLIYLDDDVRFTKDSFAYWQRYRIPLAIHGLLPGFVTYELLDGVAYDVEQVRRQSLRERPQVLCDSRNTESQGGAVFLELENPYQPCYVLDRTLAADHFGYSAYRDPLRSRAATRADWDTRARAAAGPMFDHVPPGFTSRNVIPVRSQPTGGYRIDSSAQVQHLGAWFASDDQTPFGNLRLDELIVD